jgi:hypothetical protein
MKHFQQLASFHPSQIKAVMAELTAHPELWDAHTIRRDSIESPHTGMSDIWVRYNDVAPFDESGDYSTFNDRHVPVWYPAWYALPSLRPIIRSLMVHVEGEMLGGVLITRIAPGAGIDPHADFGWHVEYYDKFYVSLQSEPGAVFWCSHENTIEGLEPKPGEVWLFDNRKRHWVVNQSPVDRITLIVCIRTELFGRQKDDARSSPQLTAVDRADCGADPT